MKKLFTYIAIVAVLVACNNDLESEGISRTTYYPDFVYEGELFMVVPEDEADEYADPGIEVLEQGEPIDFTTTVTGRYTGYEGEVVGTERDEYTVVWSAVNRDGYAATETRKVVIANTGDFVTNIEGGYLSENMRVTDEGYSDLIVMITEVEPGVFEVSDALAGFYSEGRGLGDDYQVTGLQITVTDLTTGEYTYTASAVRPADGLEFLISDLVFDLETKSLSYTVKANVASGEWTVDMTQLQPE